MLELTQSFMIPLVWSQTQLYTLLRLTGRSFRERFVSKATVQKHFLGHISATTYKVRFPYSFAVTIYTLDQSRHCHSKVCCKTENSSWQIWPLLKLHQCSPVSNVSAIAFRSPKFLPNNNVLFSMLRKDTLLVLCLCKEVYPLGR